MLEALIDRTDFSEEEAESTLRLLLEQKNEASIAAFLVLLRAKGETYEEVRVSLCEMYGSEIHVDSINFRIGLFRLWDWRRRC